MMKRIISLLVTLTLVVSSFALVASAATTGASQVISDFNIMPQSCSADSDNLVTRADFAYTIANILGSGEAAPRATDYVDVPEDDANSGYVYYATVNGFLVPEGNLFCPNDPITLYDFNDAVVKLLAYETIAQANGGGVDGAMKTVRDLKIYSGVTIKNYDSLTAKQYRQLVYNLMTTDIAEFNYSYDKDGNINMYRTGATKTILSQYFNISRYFGYITEVNNQKPSAKFRVTKNASEANPEMLVVGSDYYFISNGKVDLNFYQNIPVEVWTNKDGVIVYIAPQQNVEVFYDVIYSVNNDTNSNNAYALNLIDEIEFSRDEKEYKIDSSASVSYNGAVTRTPVKLAGKYAKIVLINNKVTFIETWNLQEGGMVQEVNNSYISYIKGEAQGKLKRIGEYENIMVIIGGRSTDRDQIKPGSLFYYYQTDDLLVIVVSEKTIVGDFESMSGDELEIGKFFYPTNGSIYVSEDGVSYAENQFDAVFGTQVICYVDIFGNIRYIQSGGYNNQKNEFTGYLIGSSQKGFDDIKIKVQAIYPEISEQTIILPTKLINSSKIDSSLHGVFASANSIAVNALTWSNRMDADSYLYKFSVNEEGVITQISKPDFYLFFGQAHDISYLENGVETVTRIPEVPARDIPLDHFAGDFRGVYIPLSLSGIGALGSTFAQFNIHNESYVVLSNKGGKLGVEKVSYDTLLAHGSFRDAEGVRVNIAMFAEPGTSHPQFWFLYGNTDKIYSYQGDEESTIDSITEKYDAETEEHYYEVVLDSGDTVWKLDSIAIDSSWSVTVPEGQTTPTTLEEGMKVYYMSGALFCDNASYITGVEVYPKSADGSDMTMEEWYQNVMPGLNKGVAKKVTDYRLFLANGGAYHLGTRCNVVGVKFKDGKVEYVDISKADIAEGDTVYFAGTYNINYIAVEYVD